MITMVQEGAGLALDTSSTVIFQSLVTFEDNVATVRSPSIEVAFLTCPGVASVTFCCTHWYYMEGLALCKS